MYKLDWNSEEVASNTHAGSIAAANCIVSAAIISDLGKSDAFAVAVNAAEAEALAYYSVARSSPERLDEAIDSDFNKLKTDFTPLDLAQEPIWPNGIPVWASRLKANFWSHLHWRNPSWKVWTDWYDRLVNGGNAIEELEINCRLGIPEEYWDQGPLVINAEINRRETEYWDRQKKDEESKSVVTEIPPMLEVPPPEAIENKPAAPEPDKAGQTPAFYRYRFDGLQFDVTYVAANLSVSKAMRDGALQTLLETLHEFHKTLEKPSKTNAYLPIKLLDKLTALSSLLSESDPNSGDYPARLRLLAASVKRSMATVFQEGGCGSEDIDDTLHEILDAIDGLKGCYREIAVIEREKLKTEIRPDNAAAVISNLKTLSDELAEVEGALTTSAQNSLHGVIDRAADDSVSEELADIAVDQTLSNRNLSRVVAQELRKQRKSLATEVVSQAKKAIAKAVVEKTASVLTLGMSRLLKFAPSLQEVIDRLASDKEDTAAVSEDDPDTDEHQTLDV